MWTINFAAASVNRRSYFLSSFLHLIQSQKKSPRHWIFDVEFPQFRQAEQVAEAGGKENILAQRGSETRCLRRREAQEERRQKIRREKREEIDEE